VRILEQLLDGPDEAQARLYLGKIFYGREEWGEAEDHLERAIELEPGDAEISYALALTYLDHIQHVSFLKKRGQANKALNQLIATLHIDPGHVDARVSLASYYLNAPGIAGGSKDKAREQMDAIIQLDPKRGYLFRAEVHESDEEWDEAWASYEDALRVAPADPQVLYLSGMFRQGREEWAEAVELFDSAAAREVTPENRVWVRASLYQVGRTGALSGENLERARDALISFSRRFPENEDALSSGAHWRLGMIYEMQGEAELARAAYEAALAVDPESEEAKEALERLRGADGLALQPSVPDRHRPGGRR
jgi:Tfp pilus assembly protein PilF